MTTLQKQHLGLARTTGVVDAADVRNLGAHRPRPATTVLNLEGTPISID